MSWNLGDACYFHRFFPSPSLPNLAKIHHLHLRRSHYRKKFQTLKSTKRNPTFNQTLKIIVSISKYGFNLDLQQWWNCREEENN